MIHPLFQPESGRGGSVYAPPGRASEHNSRPEDWRRADKAERDPLRDATRGSYVLKPFLSELGLLTDVFVPRSGDGRLATAEIRRRIPALPPGRSGHSYWSSGCAALVGSTALLPAIDLLPVPMQWQRPAGVGYSCPPTQIEAGTGNPRNVPSGAPLYPVHSAERADLPFFQPLAADPAAALRLLTPAVLQLTGQAQVAWWCEERLLFVWLHQDLPRTRRPLLAGFAQQILGALLAAG